MTMFDATSSSPRSLLWAHQLKREHGYLLGRVSLLESTVTSLRAAIDGPDPTTTELEARIASLEDALGHANVEIERLNSESKLLEEKVSKASGATRILTNVETEGLLADLTKATAPSAQNGEESNIFEVSGTSDSMKEPETSKQTSGQSGSQAIDVCAQANTEPDQPSISKLPMQIERSLSQATTVDEDDMEQEQTQQAQQTQSKKSKKSRKKVAQPRKPRRDTRTSAERKKSKIPPPTDRQTRSQTKKVAVVDGEQAEDKTETCGPLTLGLGELAVRLKENLAQEHADEDPSRQ